MGVFWKIQKICLQMGTRILKIDLEMAEKIEVKDGNPNFNFFVAVKNIFFLSKVPKLASGIQTL